jgi:hypothetical protein
MRIESDHLSRIVTAPDVFGPHRFRVVISQDRLQAADPSRVAELFAGSDAVIAAIGPVITAAKAPSSTPTGRATVSRAEEPALEDYLPPRYPRKHCPAPPALSSRCGTHSSPNLVAVPLASAAPTPTVTAPTPSHTGSSRRGTGARWRPDPALVPIALARLLIGGSLPFHLFRRCRPRRR